MSILSEQIPLLTNDEQERLVLAWVEGQGSIDAAQAIRLLEWAEGVRIDQALLSVVLKGHAVITAWSDDRPTLGLAKDEA